MLDVTETNDAGDTWWVVYPHWSGVMEAGNDRRYLFCNLDHIICYVRGLNDVPYVRKADYKWAARLADGFTDKPKGSPFVHRWGSSQQTHLGYYAFDT